MKVIGFGAALVDKQFLIKDDALNALGIEKGLMTLNSEEEQNELLTFLKSKLRPNIFVRRVSNK